jgi:hypothetical protein
MIAEIPSCKKVRVKGFVIAVKKESSCERLHDSQNSIMKEEGFVKGLCGSHRLRESLNPTESPKTTTNCGLNPTVKGIPTEKA